MEVVAKQDTIYRQTARDNASPSPCMILYMHAVSMYFFPPRMWARDTSKQGVVEATAPTHASLHDLLGARLLLWK